MADKKISQLTDGGVPQATDEFVVDRAGADNFKIDWASIKAAAEANAVLDGDAAGGVLSGTYPNPGFAADMATQAELDAEASTRAADDTTIAGGLAAHIADPTDAHVGAAIGNTPAGGIAATTVQAAINELDTEKVAAALVVLKSLYDANTILKADADDTPVALTMGASTILARLAAGNIVAATPAELRTLLALVIGTNVQAWDADLDAIAALADPNADRILFWDDSAGAYAYLTPGTNLTITNTTIDAAGGGSQSLAQVLVVGNDPDGTPIQAATVAGGIGGKLELVPPDGFGAGGDVLLTGGDGDNDQGGGVEVVAGAGQAGRAGGDLLLQSGQGNANGMPASFFNFFGNDGSGVGGQVTAKGGEGEASQRGGSLVLTGGPGNAGASAGAEVTIDGGDDTTGPGRVYITTDASGGAAGEQLTAQGDGSALWELPPGYELGYAEVTSNQSTTQTVRASATTWLTAPSITFDGSTAILIQVFFGLLGNSTTAATQIEIFEDSTNLCTIIYAQVVAGAWILPAYGELRITPAAGAKVYTARAWVSAASTGSAYCGAGTGASFAPGRIRVVKAA